MIHLKTPLVSVDRGENYRVDIDDAAGRTVLQSIHPDVATRIVACSNACDGIETQLLEQFPRGMNGMKTVAISRHRDQIMRQRDKLLEAIGADAADSIAREAFMLSVNGGHISDLYKQPERTKLRDTVSAIRKSAGMCYYATDGMLMSSDGTRSIFDDVDHDGSDATTTTESSHRNFNCHPDDQIRALAEQFICHPLSRSIEEIEMAGGMLIELLKRCDESGRISSRRWQQIHNLQPQSEALHRIASEFNLPAGTDISTGALERVKALKSELDAANAKQHEVSTLRAIAERERNLLFQKHNDSIGELIASDSKKDGTLAELDSCVEGLCQLRLNLDGENHCKVTAAISRLEEIITGLRGDKCNTCNGAGGYEAAASSTSYFWKECPDCSGVKGACVQQIAESDTQTGLSIAGETQTDSAKDAALFVFNDTDQTNAGAA